MEYRSSNADGRVHYGGDLVTGVNSTAGVHISSNTVSPASDSDNANLVLKGKGTGGVLFGASTSAITGFGAGVSTTATIALPASAIVASTLTIPGLAAGDVLFVGRAASMSTALGIVGAVATGTNEGTVYVLNNLGSTASVNSTSTFPYFYAKV